jgi:DNA-directed RNA polymerase subunit RPC12/RpoP
MAEMTFQCQVCRQNLSASESQVGTLVRCPLCKATLRVPAPQPPEPDRLQHPVGAAHGGAVRSGSSSGNASTPGYAPPPPPMQRTVYVPSHLLGLGRIGPGKRYGFNCVYCSSRLEATESQAAQEGQCPTCGSTIVIPILDRFGRLIDPITKEIIKQDPHPVHAYAAAGDRAPKIVRLHDGGQAIECPRCQSLSPITANNCKSCGMPFTMEGTTLEAAGTSNGFCVASLVLGIIGLPAFCVVVPPILAIIFGIIGYNQVSSSGSESAGRGMAIAGMICGAVGSMLFIWMYVLQ